MASAVPDLGDLKSALSSAMSGTSEAPPAEPAAESASPDSGAPVTEAVADSQPEQTTPEGSTPPEPAPAPTNTSALDYLKSRYGDEQRVGQEFLALEQRAIEQAKRIKELEAATRQPQPAPVQPVTPVPAHPEQVVSAPQNAEQEIVAAVQSDRECVSILSQWQAHEQAAQALPQALSKTAAEIAYRERRLQDVADRDPLEADEIRRDLAPLKLELERLRTEQTWRKAEQFRLDQEFAVRENRIRSSFAAQAQAREAAAEQERYIQQDAQTYAQTFATTFDQIFDHPDSGFDKDDKADLRVRAMNYCYANAHVDADKAVKTFLAGERKRLARYKDVHHRQMSREYAMAKNADVAADSANGQTAPAPAQNKPVDWDDYLAQLRNQSRRALAARR